MKNEKANRVYDRVNKLLKLSNYHALSHNNFKEKPLRKRGLHLNVKRNTVLVSKLAHAIRTQGWRSSGSNLVFDGSDTTLTDDNFFTDDNLLSENIAHTVNSISMNFKQQSKSITNDLIRPNKELNLSELIDLRR